MFYLSIYLTAVYSRINTHECLTQKQRATFPRNICIIMYPQQHRTAEVSQVNPAINPFFCENENAASIALK